MPPYQPLGDLQLQFEDQDQWQDYRRELDLGTAIMRVTYRIGDAHYTREIFSSAADQLIVIAFLPALPKAWPNRSITGLRARGAVGIDIEWSGG